MYVNNTCYLFLCSFALCLIDNDTSTRSMCISIYIYIYIYPWFSLSLLLLILFSFEFYPTILSFFFLSSHCSVCLVEFLRSTFILLLICIETPRRTSTIMSNKANVLFFSFHFFHLKTKLSKYSFLVSSQIFTY